MIEQMKVRAREKQKEEEEEKRKFSLFWRTPCF
jgi:hypothetical protein